MALRWLFRIVMLVLIDVLLVGSSVAAGQETGNLYGTVFSRDGFQLTDATVTVSGPRLPTGRSMTTNAEGRYRFDRLPPGEYSLEVAIVGYRPEVRAVYVEAGRDRNHNFVLMPSLEETVTVTATTSAVDLISVEVSSNVRRALVDLLPVERSYRGLIQLAPGIASNQSFAPSGGGSRQDNNFLLDGATITNPYFGYLATEVNDLDIEDMHIRRGAVSPEYGRAPGLVANGVTKSGTNRFAGTLRADGSPGFFRAIARDGLEPDTVRGVVAASLGGPIVRDRLFYYASGRTLRATRTKDSRHGDAPDGKDSADEVFGKISAQLSGQHLVDVSYRYRPTRGDFVGLEATDPTSLGRDVTGLTRVGLLNWSWFPGQTTTLTFKLLHLDEHNRAQARSVLDARSVFDPTRLSQMGRVTDGVTTLGAAALSQDRADYTRTEARVTLSHAFDAGRSSHLLKVGGWWDEGTEDLSQQSNGWGDIIRVALPDESGDNQVLWQASYLLPQASQITGGRTFGIFLQDAMSMGRRVTVNAGLLVTRDVLRDGPRSGGTPRLTFGWQQEIQPRVGLNFPMRPEVGDKLFVSYGRSYVLDQKSLARVVSASPLAVSQSWFEADGRLHAEGTLPSSVARSVADNLRPPVMDEFGAGYASPIGTNWSLDVYALWRRYRNIIEDRPAVLPFSQFVINNDPSATRDYRTLVVDLSRRLDRGWAMRASYGWSRLSGTYDQDYAGGLVGIPAVNAGSVINNGPGAFTADTGRQGPLSQDRPHVAKLFGSWTLPGSEAVMLGGSVQYQSGTPWQAQGWSWSGQTPIRLLEAVGSHRLPGVTTVDLLARLRTELSATMFFTFEARLFNLFDQQTKVAIDVLQHLDPRVLGVNGLPSAECLSCWTQAFAGMQTQTLPNPRFGQPTAFSSPRRLIFTALFDF